MTNTTYFIQYKGITYKIPSNEFLDLADKNFSGIKSKARELGRDNLETVLERDCHNCPFNGFYDPSSNKEDITEVNCIYYSQTSADLIVPFKDRKRTFQFYAINNTCVIDESTISYLCDNNLLLEFVDERDLNFPHILEIKTKKYDVRKAPFFEYKTLFGKVKSFFNL